MVFRKKNVFEIVFFFFKISSIFKHKLLQRPDLKLQTDFRRFAQYEQFCLFSLLIREYNFFGNFWIIHPFNLRFHCPPTKLKKTNSLFWRRCQHLVNRSSIFLVFFYFHSVYNEEKSCIAIVHPVLLISFNFREKFPQFF